RMIAIKLAVTFLQSYLRIVVVVEHGVSALEHRNALAVNAGRVEHECRTRLTKHLHNLRRGEIFQLDVRHRPWMVFAMTAADVVESAAANVSQIKRQLQFPRNVFVRFLVVPRVAVPAVEVTLRRQRSPTTCFGQFYVAAEVTFDDAFYDR